LVELEREEEGKDLEMTEKRFCVGRRERLI
jgi:hypothetical protein